MNKLFAITASAFLVVGAAASPAQAATVLVNFDVAQAGYTPTPGVIQHVTNQFGSLGVIFRDQKSLGKGASLGQCGPGNGAVSFFGFGNNGTCGDYTPNIDIDFVDPINNGLDGYTTSFSIFNFDGLIQATAFDAMGAVLGTTQNESGLLTLSGIGNISRVNLKSLDQNPTTMDDLQFESVMGSAIPEPATWIMMLMGFGLIGAAMRRKRQNVQVSFG